MSFEKTLGEIAEIVMGQSPSGDTCNDIGNGIPLLNGPTEFGHKHPVPVQFTTDARKTSIPNDLLFCVRGSTTGKMNWSDQEYAIGRGLAAIRGKDGYPNSFVRSVIEVNLDALLVQATGSTFPNVSRELISSLVIPNVSKKLAQEVASIVEPLDNRITLLRETNATLEAIAQALFKSWFVDFDPVRAKSEGRFPEGMDEATAALFPDAFEENELGTVPKGWRVLPFLDACDLQGGSQPPASVFIDKLQDGYVRLLQIRDFSSDAHTTYIPDTTKLKKVTEDDVLIGRYGSASGDKAKDSLGRVCRGLSGAYNVALMKLNPLLVGREYAFQLVSDPRFYNYLQAVSSKAVQSGFSKSELAQYKIVLPNSALIELYEQFGVDFWLATKITNERINILKTLRDTLLPRLLSGQMSIDDAEAELEKVTA
jgi:type I restriction enzyme, S subunit